MSIRANQVFSAYRKQNAALASYKKELDEVQGEEQFIADLRLKIDQESSQNQVFDWENKPNRALLERVYQLKEFEDLYPTYRFDNPKKMQPLLERIESYHEQKKQDLQLKHHFYQEKKSSLLRYHDEVLRTIQMLSSSMSTLLK